MGIVDDIEEDEDKFEAESAGDGVAFAERRLGGVVAGGFVARGGPPNKLVSVEEIGREAVSGRDVDADELLLLEERDDDLEYVCVGVGN